MLGVDIVEVSRIERLSERDRFLTRIFTDVEIEYLESKSFNAHTIAGMLAAKEAVSKAFKTGISKELVFKSIEILHNADGSPYVNELNNDIQPLLKDKNAKAIEINISHDGNYAVAVAKLVFDKKEHKEYKEFSSKLLKRSNNSNKYDYGRVMIIGGSKGMTGSIMLAGNAALRSGAGMVYLLVPQVISSLVEAKTCEEIVLSMNDDGDKHFGNFKRDDLLELIQDKSVIAIGPGLGTGDHAKKILEIVINNFDGPILVDADAINQLAKNPDLIKDNIYITPHNMEFSRLSSFTLNEIEYNREESVKYFLDKYHVNIVLKGRNSIVANDKNYYVNTTGNPGMATAGSGDVLTGVIAALLARHDNFDMFKLAVFVHGLAGDMAADKYGQTSLRAKDIIEFLPKAFGEINED
ncbi:NAD(P)H-hydrate dehydratase [uncultured Helcococcus sp.]|uniref:NAD(P)H-hydrate dehydratase n=1 Tax=uncultured Helcococcus sp. TaxID=1072508 RepID=UPI00288C34EE|nr:NAD(P)H-hydrate dehydratase [uncultured Helcococcus sp.]